MFVIGAYDMRYNRSGNFLLGSYRKHILLVPSLLCPDPFTNRNFARNVNKAATTNYDKGEPKIQ